jgi:hypothetical protein
MKKSILILIGIIFTLALTAQTHTYTTVYDQEMTSPGTLTAKQYLGGMRVTVRIVSSGNYRITFNIPGGPNDPVTFNVSYTTEYYDNGTLWYAYTDNSVYKGNVQVASNTKLSTMATNGRSAIFIVGMTNGFTHLYTLDK